MFILTAAGIFNWLTYRLSSNPPNPPTSKPPQQQSIRNKWTKDTNSRSFYLFWAPGTSDVVSFINGGWWTERRQWDGGITNPNSRSGQMKAIFVRTMPKNIFKKQWLPWKATYLSKLAFNSPKLQQAKASILVHPLIQNATHWKDHSPRWMVNYDFIFGRLNSERAFCWIFDSVFLLYWKRKLCISWSWGKGWLLDLLAYLGLVPAKKNWVRSL